MANSYLTAGEIAVASIVSLSNRTVLAQTVWRDAEASFRGKIGDTVTVRVESLPGSARTYDTARGSEIVMDDLAETSVAVELDTFLYKGTNVRDEDLTLDVADFNGQITLPLVKAVANGAEALVATRINAVASSASASYADVIDGLLDAESELNDNDVPMEDRVIYVGTNVRKALLKSDELLHVDKSGSDDALRSAIVGDLFGATVVFSNRIDTDSAVFAHKSAFVLAFKALEVPAGATFGESINYDGFAIRFIRDYDPRFQQDRAVASVLAGGATVLDGGELKRAVKVTFA